MEEIKLFYDKEIRTLMVDGNRYYAVVDVIAILTESPEPRKYWSKLKKKAFTDLQLSPVWRQLKLPSLSDKKLYKTDCADNEGLLRIIQSVPSKNAEPFKIWLAEVGGRAIDEKTNKRLAAFRKLKESQSRLYENIKGRGVSEEEFDEIIRNGDDALFNNTDMKKKYGIGEDESIDEFMHALLLHGKGFATEMTNINSTQHDLKGKQEVNDNHSKNNEGVRNLLSEKTGMKPEDLPAEKDLKKLKGKKGGKKIE
ncbi:BRO family protein [Flexithrix dorotheae]|uniref:BRO family protein n=1 Tax=Flexithrix dorotheae TaxID=70993 RepID=UPI0003761567|nr:BRO family protein [Flexithrix dorotheae]